jgi:hypothetical protein
MVSDFLTDQPVQVNNHPSGCCQCHLEMAPFHLGSQRANQYSPVHEDERGGEFPHVGTSFFYHSVPGDEVSFPNASRKLKTHAETSCHLRCEDPLASPPAWGMRTPLVHGALPVWKRTQLITDPLYREYTFLYHRYALYLPR